MSLYEQDGLCLCSDAVSSVGSQRIAVSFHKISLFLFEKLFWKLASKKEDCVFFVREASYFQLLLKRVSSV